jgi:hypothetical protein
MGTKVASEEYSQCVGSDRLLFNPSKSHFAMAIRQTAICHNGQRTG